MCSMIWCSKLRSTQLINQTALFYSEVWKESTKNVFSGNTIVLEILKYHIVSVVDSIEATIQVFEQERER